MRTAVHVALWNIAFVLLLLAFLVTAASLHVDMAAFGLPTVFAMWLVVLGAKFARRRWAIVACAVVSVVLLVLQIAVFAFFAWWQQGFGNTGSSTGWQVLIIFVAIGGALVVGWFLRTKLRAADESTTSR